MIKWRELKSKILKFVGMGDTADKGKELRAIIETAFKMAEIQPAYTVFKDVLRNTILSTAPAFSKDSFIKATHSDKSKIAEEVSATGLMTLNDFFKKYEGDDKQWYMSQSLKFFRALTVLGTQKATPDKTEADLLFYLRDDLRNNLFIDPMEGMVAAFQPIVDRITNYFKEIRETELILNQIELTKFQKGTGKILAWASVIISMTAVIISLYFGLRSKMSPAPPIYLLPTTTQTTQTQMTSIVPQMGNLWKIFQPLDSVK